MTRRTLRALLGASAALTISGIPFMGPIGGARVGYVNGEYVLNTTPEQAENLIEQYLGPESGWRGLLLAEMIGMLLPGGP